MDAIAFTGPGGAADAEGTLAEQGTDLSLEMGATHLDEGFVAQDVNTREKKNFGPSVLDGAETMVDGTLTDVTGTRYVFLEDHEGETTAKLLYGSAFRAPSFGQLFNVNNPANLGNPELDPEEVDTFEAVFEYRPIRGLSAAVSVFDSTIDVFDEMGREPSDPGIPDDFPLQGRAIFAELRFHVP